MSRLASVAFALCLALSVALPVALAAGAHPSLLFENITQTPGYQNQSKAPWSEWQAEILSIANGASLLQTWRGAVKGYTALNQALAYHILKTSDATKAAGYRDKAITALKELDGSHPPVCNMMVPQGVRAIGLLYYSLAYDLIQPELGSSDGAVRDKLAALAAGVYDDMVHAVDVQAQLCNGASPASLGSNYISFVDWLGQAYPALGIAGTVLSDYQGSQSSTPADWLKTGTDYYFVLDKLHPRSVTLNIPLLAYEADSAGADYFGSYKLYYADDLAWWAQVYSHTTGRNLLEVYPTAKALFVAEVWQSLPNRYSSNFCTNGNLIWDYQRAVLNLLSEKERAWVLSQLEALDPQLLPHSRSLSHYPYATQVPATLLYLTFGNYASLARTNPPWTSHLSRDSIYQVLRSSWDKESEWLSLVTVPQSHPASSHRNTDHHDQLALEYYGRGDLLLADAGELRDASELIISGKRDGQFEVHHNAIAIENPRKSFGTSGWAQSVARGIFKGTSTAITTPVAIGTLVQTPWVEALEARATLEKVVGNSNQSTTALSSPINYARTIVFPEKSYFVIFDSFQSNEEWVYRTYFRLSSFGITPTGSSIGHVNGTLELNGSAYNWLGQTYAVEQATGIATHTLKWSTTSPYQKQVELRVVTAPRSEVVLNKHATRIGGYGGPTEVYLPVVSFRSPSLKAHSRITALLARHPEEAALSAEELQVTGSGSALKVGEDIFYAGTGSSTVSAVTTNASLLWLRSAGEYLLLKGSSLTHTGRALVSASALLNALALKREGTQTTLVANAAGAVSLTLGSMEAKAFSITKNGALFTGWSRTADSQGLVLPLESGDSTFVIQQSDSCNLPGACGSDCSPCPQPAHATATCAGATAPAAQACGFTCQPGYADRDTHAANGCEACADGYVNQDPQGLHCTLPDGTEPPGSDGGLKPPDGGAGALADGSASGTEPLEGKLRGGCGCQVTAPSGLGLLPLLALVALLLRRRGGQRGAR